MSSATRMTFLSGRIMDRFGRRATTVPGFSILAVALIGMALTAFAHMPFETYVAAFLFAPYTMFLAFFPGPYLAGPIYATAVVLCAIPGPPAMDAETADQVRALMAKGCAGTIFLTTEDCHAAYEELKGRGVEFVEQPEERPYGIDSAFRDPSGNHIRLTQVREFAAV